MNTALPLASKLIPYLDRIDANKVYTNFGPLVTEYENRLSNLFQAPVVTTSSATSALTATLIALNLPKLSFVACPSWTFIATPAAIVAAGHIPYFTDVDKDGVMRQISSVHAAIVVAPCGAYIPIPKFNVPTIIDAAGGFDAFSTVCLPRNIPVVISTHASKPFGTGEGGFVTCHDKPLLAKIRQIINFGFTPERKATLSGFNAKLSEYHAAVGLAELDGWEDKRDRFLRRTRIYGLDYVTSLVAVKDGIGKKLIYGCHQHPAYKEYPRTDLTNTEELMRKMSFVRVEI